MVKISWRTEVRRGNGCATRVTWKDRDLGISRSQLSRAKCLRVWQIWQTFAVYSCTRVYLYIYIYIYIYLYVCIYALVIFQLAIEPDAFPLPIIANKFDIFDPLLSNVDINSVRKRERERKQNKRKKYLSSTDDWTKTAAKRKKTTTGLGFRSSRNGSAIPLFGASLEISRYAYSRRKDEADIVAVSSRRFARCFAYRVSRVCVHATRTYLFFSPVHRVNGDSS